MNWPKNWDAIEAEYLEPPDYDEDDYCKRCEELIEECTCDTDEEEE